MTNIWNLKGDFRLQILYRGKNTRQANIVNVGPIDARHPATEDVRKLDM